MKLKVKQWGSSKAIILPKPILDLLNIDEDVEVNVVSGGLTIKKRND